MRLELSRRAQADLDDIRDYSVEQFGLERAILCLNLIEQAFRRLLDYPHIGSPRHQFAAEVLSYPVGEHRIFYEVRPNEVHILRLVHKAMEVERRVQGELID